MKVRDCGVKPEFRNISTNFQYLKEFPKLRENDSLFDEVKAHDGIGMPVFVFEDGTKTLDLNEALNQLRQP